MSGGGWREVGILCLFGSGVFVGSVVLLVFSHFAVGGCRGILSLFELVSSSCSVAWSSLLPLMLSPSPSSDKVKSRDASATSPYGLSPLVVVFPTFGRISGSCISVDV